mgnify:CR=1 FL=1
MMFIGNSVSRDRARVKRIEFLYQKSGRTNGLYTGLAQHYRWYKRAWRRVRNYIDRRLDCDQ